MSRAKIVAGIWEKNIKRTWKFNGEWRTDIFKSVLSDPRFRECRFVLENGPTVIVSAEELRRVVEGGSEHYDGKIWGPFSINPTCGTIAGRKVQMEIK
jgi:hypothetical protein